MTKKLIVANWKMNPVHKIDAEELFTAVAAASLPQDVEVVISPPAIYLEPLSDLLSEHFAVKRTHLFLSAQDVFFKEAGAATGEISPAMLQDLGVRYSIVGHSERRAMGDDDIEIRRKVEALLADGIVPILCVGEPLEVRGLGAEESKNFVLAQLQADLPAPDSRFQIPDSVVIAYEPVWAISTATGHEDETPEDAVRMIIAIKDAMHSRFGREPRVLYGGSVAPANARDFLSRPEIDGVLVGKASLNAEEFSAILNAVHE